MVAANINDMSCEVRRRRWNWLGHVLRKGGENDCVTVLDWRPEGRRARERPRMTWTVEKNATRQVGRTSVWSKRRHKTERVGQTT